MARALTRFRSDFSAAALARLNPGQMLSDKLNPGLRARRQGDGPPVLELRYRPPGRRDQRRTLKLGSWRPHPQDTAGAVPFTVMQALNAYAEAMVALEAGRDPQDAPAGVPTLRPALDGYDASLERRGIVKRKDVMSLLRRELLAPLGDVPLASLTRAKLVERIREIEKSGRAGTARDFRTRAGVFLGFCVDEGLLPANPLAGHRRPRASRAERLDRPGRALADWELPALWRAAAEAGPPFGPYLLTLLLTGQRRTETALMRWRDLDLGAGVWTIPAEVTKSGREHRVPLPALARRIIRAQERRGELVFAGRGGRPMSGWSKRLRPVREVTAAAGLAFWTPHDLRRTMRSGLSALGVERDIRELLLNHALSDELAQAYDRAERWPARMSAARRWALHVLRSRSRPAARS